ncbi:MAG TPA: RNA-binding protein [Gammaproteobacteria bacterium]|nr:RNA-binding protein [Gammaproteobacteria bacterium]
MNIYVGNLSYGVTEDELRSAFVKFGNVTRVNLIIDRETGRSKGFGFVEMPDDSAAEAAIKALNGADLDGRSMKVSEARPRERRPRF